jgi:hypothetical protein
MAVPKKAGKPLGLLIALSIALTMAGPAQATTFDSAHEPPVIGNPGVTTATSNSSFSVTLALGLICPAGQPIAYSVTFEDPTGSRSIPLLEPCTGTWQSIGAALESPWNFSVFGTRGYPSEPGIPGVTGSGSAGTNPSATFLETMATTPFLYQVTGPAGVVAQGAMTATVTPPEEINENTEIDRFINTCIDGSHEVKSKEEGKLYCEVGGSTSYTAGGWPAPAPPPAPPAVEQPEKPEPLWKPLTLATAKSWVSFALAHNFHYDPKGLWVSRCGRKGTGRYRCNVSWRHGPNAFAGTTEVGKLDVYTGAYTYGLRVVRTEVRTHRRHTFTVAYGRTAKEPS